MNFKITKKAFKKYLVDYFSLTTFNTLAVGIGEYFFLGLSFQTMTRTRSIAATYNLINGKVYAIFREFWAKFFKTGHSSSRVKKFLVDTSANMFYGTTYFLLLLVSGVSLKGIWLKIPLVALFGFFTGRLYGKYHDFLRKKFNMEPILDK